MRKIIYLSRHKQSITGGHKYNDAFESYLEQLSGIKVKSTPSCGHAYQGWKKILAPFAELKYLKLFVKDSLIIFSDSAYKYHVLLALLGRLFFRSKTTIIVHHFPFIGVSGIRGRIDKWLMCKYASMIDSIIVPSPYTLDVANKLFPQKTIYYIPLPFERNFNKSSEYEQGNLLYVGTVEERKGLTYLIDAISLLDNKNLVKLNIVGKVVDEAYYKKILLQIDSLGLSGNVSFWGRVSEETLNECYRRAEMFTFPSLLEGYGIVLVEAFNNALPIICFDNSAMPYTVKDGINGFVAKNKDSKDLACKIKMLIGNKSLRDRLQDGIKDSVMSLKTKKDFEEKILEFWESISK